MTRGKQKIEAQKKNAEKNQKAKGSQSQIEARAVGLQVVCPICRTQLANKNQLVDHYGSKHPKEEPPSSSG